MSYIIEEIARERAIEKYSNKNRLLKEAIAYVGHPKQSASEPDKIFLRLNPLLDNGSLLEFNSKDILFAENIETVANEQGESFQIFKIWVRIGSVAIKLEQFIV